MCVRKDALNVGILGSTTLAATEHGLVEHGGQCVMPCLLTYIFAPNL
jgi:hypothetical protein